MKTIKTTIATTLPDIANTKFTKEALDGMRDQINKGDIEVYDLNWNKIGKVKSASIPIDTKNLEVVMKIDDKLIDKSFEWFFVPYGIPVDIGIEGKFEVTRKADLKCIQATNYSTDLSLKPTRFDMEFTEGVDYFVKKYEDLTPELVLEFIEKGLSTWVYYPQSLGADNIIKDAIERGLIVDSDDETGGDFVHPFTVSALPLTFEEFKKQVDLSWRNFSSMKTKDPLLRNTESQ